MAKKHMVDLDEMGWLIHDTSVKKGFYDVEDIGDIHFVLSKLALIHSEVTETLEAIRKDQGEDKIMEEIADVAIRLLDFVQLMKDTAYVSREIKLSEVIEEKMKVNNARPQKHGNLA